MLKIAIFLVFMHQRLKEYEQYEDKFKDLKIRLYMDSKVFLTRVESNIEATYLEKYHDVV